MIFAFQLAQLPHRSWKCLPEKDSYILICQEVGRRVITNGVSLAVGRTLVQTFLVQEIKKTFYIVKFSVTSITSSFTASITSGKYTRACAYLEGHSIYWGLTWLNHKVYKMSKGPFWGLQILIVHYLENSKSSACHLLNPKKYCNRVVGWLVSVPSKGMADQSLISY